MADNCSFDSRFVIGIDLGTTQCALFYADLKDKSLKIRSLPITQLISEGQAEALPTLPSVIYIDDSEDNCTAPDWVRSSGLIIGRCAQELASSAAQKTVSSAKSWLCHPRADRKSPILPWQSQNVRKKISPVEATSELLSYMRRFWNHSIAQNDEGLKFENQQIIVAVPASFDPSAKNLTLEAIESAQIKNVKLIEEPQAAFYDYLQREGKRAADELKGINTVLVVDIGGGTTDFSLIGVEWAKDAANPSFTRLAVGAHLLIGGDNLDLAVARLAEAEFKHRGIKLASKQWLLLLKQCRQAKEAVLSGKAKNDITFAVTGVSSRVIAGASKITLKAEQIEKTLIEGFFKLTDFNEAPNETDGLGLSEAGLPFTKDAVITKHLAAFLSENNASPDAILFNGGTTQAESVKARLLEALTLWLGKAVRVISNPHPILAVAAGAAYYGLVSMGYGQKIQSGSAVSIYLGIGNSTSSAPQKYIPKQLVCLLPKASEIERDYVLKSRTFGVDISRDSAFYLFYTPSPPKAEEMGRIIRFNSKRYFYLPPCLLKAGTAKGEKQVSLKIRLCETGYLKIFCEEINGSFKQELRFDLEEKTKPSSETKQQSPQRRVIAPARLKRVSKLLDSAFAKEIEYNTVFKHLESILECLRASWNAEMLRQLFDLTAERQKEFEGSLESLDLYFRLLGFCLRPGYGVLGDEKRVDYVYNSLTNEYDFDNPEFYSDRWVMFKRIAPGLSAERQEAIKAFIEPMLFAAKKFNKHARIASQHERNQLWRLLGQLERLSIAEKERLAWFIIKAPTSFGVDSAALIALSRLCARQLTYAPDTAILPQAVANDIAKQLLKKAASGGSYFDCALREIGRKTGDKLVQIDDAVRKNIIDVFKKKMRKKSFMQPLLKAAPLEEQDLTEIIGEALPSGFIWVSPNS